MKQFLEGLKVRLTNKGSLLAIGVSGIALINLLHPVDVPYLENVLNAAAVFFVACGIVNDPTGKGAYPLKNKDLK